VKYDGNCYWKINKKNNSTEQEDHLTGYIRAEGGVSTAYILYVLLWRLWGVSQRCRTERITKAELDGRKQCGGTLFFLSIPLFWANFGLTVSGM
jgi:hypothetical protein